MTKPRPRVAVQRERSDLALPHFATEGSAGADLTAPEDFSARPGEIQVVASGLRVALPPGCYGRVEGRSSLERQGLHLLGGIIDNDYRGEIGIILVNLSRRVLRIRRGERLAQLIVSPYICPIFEEGPLMPTERGEGGFGSTGA
jgi:dUTP pyrophosphatase